MLGEGLLPPIVAQRFEFFVHNICAHDAVNHKLTESLELLAISIDNVAKFRVLFIHEKIPCEIHRVLLRHTLVLVDSSDLRMLFHKLRIGNTWPISSVKEIVRLKHRLPEQLSNRDTA